MIMLGLALLLTGPGRAAGSAPASLTLDREWLLMTGDDKGWADPDFDDAGWSPVEVGRPWEEAGFENYDGFAWYRTRWVVPASWREHPATQALGAFLILSLGPIDDVDETFVNGIRVGQTGGMPPTYATAYAQARTYRIPHDLVRWGQTNVLAVRVYDGEAPGGIYQGPVQVRPPVLADVLELSLQPHAANGIVEAPGALALSCVVVNHLDYPVSLELTGTLRSDRVTDPPVLVRHRFALEVNGGGEARRALSFDPPGPGFYRVTCALEGEAAGGEPVSMILGYAPEELSPPLTREPDFGAFWRDRRKALAKVDPAFRMLPTDLSSDELAVYLVEMRSYGDVLIRAWYSVPGTPGPHPAVLSVPGYTSTMEPVLDRPDVATLALNPRGHGNSKDDLDPGGEELMFLGFEPGHPEGYFYAGAFMDCVRAVDFLVSRPEVDASRIAVEGGSQGGGLTFATAALDRRIACCAPDIPWMGDWVGYLEANTWPQERYAGLQERFPGLTHQDINRFLSYFDTMNLADRIRCPVLMSVGLQDDVCPPRTAFATYNRVRAEKTYRVYPWAGHQVPGEHYQLKRTWMAGHLGIDGRRE
jgi:cephalosporin-C deacetylase-like acetyl esterase